MKTVATNIKLRTILTDIRNGRLIPRPEFQRRLVWADRHKNAFIETVLMGYPFPEIYIAGGDVNLETGEGYQMLVDGQQRISTLNEYFVGSPALKLMRGVKKYNELDVVQKGDFLDYAVVARDLGVISIEHIKQVFERINSTKYALNAMEVHNARYDGEFKKFGEELAEDEFFDSRRIFSTQDIRRMNDLVFVLTLVISVLSTYFNRDDELEVYLKQYNDEFEQKYELKKEFKEIFLFIQQCDFEPNCRVWKKADLFTLMVELYRLFFRQRKTLDPGIAGSALSDFYRKVDATDLRNNKDDEAAIEKYKRDTLQGTNDRSSRLRRGLTIYKIIADL